VLIIYHINEDGVFNEDIDIQTTEKRNIATLQLALCLTKSGWELQWAS
jgi:hypothetical protein